MCYILTSGEISWINRKGPDSARKTMEEPKKKVRLYALSTCPVCNRLKRYLDEHSIEYELIEVDLLESGEQWVTSKELKKHNPQASFPTLVIEEVVLGFDEKAIKDSLGIQ